MNLQELLKKNKNNINKIKKIYRENFPLFEDYEEEFYNEDYINNTYNKFFVLFDEKFIEFLNLELEPSNNVIFILKLKETLFESKYKKSYIHSFSCKKNEILNKMSEEFSMWDENKPRIEHYCYDYTPIKELLNTEIFFSNDVSEIEVICTILHEIFIHGFTEKNREENLQNLISKLEISIKNIEAGETIDFDTFFEKLENEVLETISEKEKEKILKERELKNKNKNRDKLYLSLVCRINHKKCIQLVEEWCIFELLNNNIKI